MNRTQIIDCLIRNSKYSPSLFLAATVCTILTIVFFICFTSWLINIKHILSLKKVEKEKLNKKENLKVLISNLILLIQSMIMLTIALGLTIGSIVLNVSSHYEITEMADVKSMETLKANKDYANVSNNNNVIVLNNNKKMSIPQSNTFILDTNKSVNKKDAKYVYVKTKDNSEYLIVNKQIITN